jgi:hypothetical protein
LRLTFDSTSENTSLVLSLGYLSYILFILKLGNTSENSSFVLLIGCVVPQSDVFDSCVILVKLSTRFLTAIYGVDAGVDCGLDLWIVLWMPLRYKNFVVNRQWIDSEFVLYIVVEH